MRLAALGVCLLVGLAACGTGRDAVSTTGRAPDRAGTNDLGAPSRAVDTASVTGRWRVVKTTSREAPLTAGEVVEFRTGGVVAAGPDLAVGAMTWSLADGRLEVTTPTGAVAYTATVAGDVLRLVDGSGRSDVLRRFDGLPTRPPQASAELAEGQFLSMLARGRVESATLTQSGTTITVTGIYLGESRAERYTATLRRCEMIHGLAALFRAHGVLTDGMSPSDADC